MIDTRCGDALELFRDIESGSIDLIIADPPYNLGKGYGNNSDSRSRKEYLEFTREWLKLAADSLKPDGTMYVFMGVKMISYLYAILEEEIGLHFNSWIVWHYTQGIGKTRGFSPRHDDILYFTKSASNFTFNIEDIKIPQKFYRERNNMRGANPGNVWTFSHVHYSNPNRQAHPTQKPEGLIERMVLASSNEGDTVLDPFSGSGTTQRVCQQLGRDCVGFEENPEYVQMTLKRLSIPFNGFDSADERIFRVPNDLRREAVRSEYLKNHVQWFLKHHGGDGARFIQTVREKYGDAVAAEASSYLETASSNIAG